MLGQLITPRRHSLAIALATGIVASTSACQRVQSPGLGTVELSILQPDFKLQECAVVGSEQCKYKFEFELAAPLTEDLHVFFETRQQNPNDFFYSPNFASASIEAEQHADLVKVIPASNTFVTIEHGKKKGALYVEILPDDLAEPDELFVVALKLARQDLDRVHFGQGIAVGVILDDNDSAPVVQFAQLGNKRIPDSIGRYNLKIFLVAPSSSDKVTDRLDKSTMKASGYDIVLPVKLTITDSAGKAVPASTVFTSPLLNIPANTLDPKNFQTPGPKEPLDVNGDPIAAANRLWINLPIDIRDTNNPLRGDLTVSVSIDWGDLPIKGVSKPQDIAKLTTSFTLTKSEGTQAVNRTGVTHCLTTQGWYTQDNYCDAPEKANFPGQDADFNGKIALDANNFELISIDRSVEVVDPKTNVKSTIIVPDQCVRDLTTGLIWEVKLSNTKNELSYRDLYRVFDWYEQERSLNGGDKRERNHLSAGAICGLWEGTFCTTYDYIARMNKDNFCGHSNWRLPKLDELQSIVDFGSQTPPGALLKKPMIPSIFGPTVTGYYWTAITTADNPNMAWVVNFGDPQNYDTVDDGRAWRNDKTIPESLGTQGVRPIYTRLVTQ